MSCKNATAPINITSDSSGPCEQKCNLSFSYQKSDTSVENNGDYLKLSYDDAPLAPVTFNSKKYTVSEIRIYSPSLHQFDGVNADGELIIVHSSSTSNLLICIPIRESNAVNTSSTTMQMLIPKIAKYAKKSGDSARLNVDSFTLNSLVPITSFYSYTGTLPYYPCNSNVNYVVFPLTYKGAISISSDNLKLLKKTITASVDRIATGVPFFFNENGPTKQLGAADDIYIDCRPTGEDGEVIMPIKQDESVGISFDKRKIKKLLSNPLIIVLLGSLFMYIILKMGRGIFEKLSSIKKPSTPNIRMPKLSLRKST